MRPIWNLSKVSRRAYARIRTGIPWLQIMSTTVVRQRHKVKPIKWIEHLSTDYESAALPLCYTGIDRIVGFEPAFERWQRPVLTKLYDIRITGTAYLYSQSRKRAIRTPPLGPRPSVLPLHHALVINMGRTGVEPAVSFSPAAYKAAALTAELPPKDSEAIFVSFPFFPSVCKWQSQKPVTGDDPAIPVWKTGVFPTTPHRQVAASQSVCLYRFCLSCSRLSYIHPNMQGISAKWSLK